LGVKACLFDFDGTLVMSEPLHWSAWREACLGLFGVSVTDAFLKARAGQISPVIGREILEAASSRPVTDSDVARLGDKKNEIYASRVSTELRPYPGVLEGVAKLKRAGIRTAVVSNARSRELELGIAAVGLEGIFDFVASREDFPRPKPAPDGYLAALAALGVSAQEAVVVEDAPVGVAAGLAAGVSCVAVLSNFPREAFPAVVPAFASIAHWFESGCSGALSPTLRKGS